MAVSPLPNFAGDPNSARDILEYLTDPTNAGLLDLETRLEALIVVVGLKVEHPRQESAPTSAEAGFFWTKPSTGVTYYCHTTYAEGEPAPDTKWTAVTDSNAVAAVQAVAQATSATPQVSLLNQTISGMGADLSISAAEKATLKLIWDEMISKKATIDINAVRYSLTGSTDYTDYVTTFAALETYVGTTLSLFNDMNSATTIASTSTWNNTWSNALTDEATISDAIRTAGQDLLDTIDSNVNTVQAQLDEMTADGIISPQEKLRFRDEWTRVQDEYGQLSAQATEYAQTAVSQWTNLAATYASLTTYLGTTTNVFNDMSTSTTLSDVGSNATEWQTKWQAYYTDAKVFDRYIDTYFSSLLDAQDASLQGFIDDLQSIASDGIISGGSEKQQAKRSWDDIVRLHNRILYQAAKYSVTTPASYTTAYDALNTYLNTTIDLFTDLTSDTAVTRAVYNSKFDDFFFQYDGFTDLVADAQRTAVDSAPADYEDYKALIDGVIDDGIISAGMEKTRFNAIWLDIQATHNIIVAAGSSAGASTVALSNAYTDLSSYIGSLTASGGSTPNFTIEGEDTAIGVSTFYSKMRAYEQAKAQLETDIVNQLIELQAGNARSILDINDDGIVSVSEKNQLYKDWLKYTAEKSQLDAQASLLSITTERTEMNSAYDTLDTYLGSLDGGSGVFNDLTSATTLTTGEKANWDTNWNSFFTKYATLETTIIATIQGNVSAVGSSAFKKDGSVAATGDFDLANYNINNLLAKTLAAAGSWAATTGQLYTEQQARVAHEGLNVAHGTSGAIVGTSDNQTLTSKTINADSNTISELEVDNLKAGVVEGDVLASVAVDDSTIPSTLATKTAINDHAASTDGVHGLTAGQTIVGASATQILTNKTIDADNNTISNLETDSFKNGVISTTVGATGSDTILVSEQGIREAIAAAVAAIPTPDYQWVTVGNIETTNTGTNAIVAEGTLVLPAGKTWKYVKLVYMAQVTYGNTFDEINRIDVDANNDTSNFVFNSVAGVGAGGTDPSTDTNNITYMAEGVPSITNQDITIKAYSTNAPELSRRAYIVGIAG